jgi:ABC-type transport system involved in Fe-S cluster assembly fused permease/ATPase subunit
VLDRGTSSIVSLLQMLLFTLVPVIADILVAITYFISQFDAYYGKYSMHLLFSCFKSHLHHACIHANLIYRRDRIHNNRILHFFYGGNN